MKISRRIRIVLALGLAVVCMALLWVARNQRDYPPSDADRIALIITLGIVLVIVPIGLIVATFIRKPTWQPLPTLSIRVMAILDTMLASLFALYLLVTTPDGRAIILLLCGTGALQIMLAHARHGLHVSISELLAFYTGISLLDVITGRAPHDRVHPLHGEHGAWEVRLYSIRSIGDVVGYVLVIVPTLATTLMTKASAILTAPLLYLGLAFDERDYLKLSLDARRRWRSSFKGVMLALSIGSLAFFIAKVFLYVKWNELSGRWNSTPFLVAISGPIAPAGFLPWHFVLPIQALLLFWLTAKVDSVIHALDDKHLAPESLATSLKLIRAGFRLRSIFTWYVVVCLLWLIVPWLSSVSFPPITWSILPR